VLSFEAHSHQSCFQQSILYEGTPEAFGGLEFLWHPGGGGGHIPTLTSDALTAAGIAAAAEPAGGVNNVKLLAEIRSRAARVQREGGPPARQICHVTGQLESVPGVPSSLGDQWDRHPIVDCVPWSFEPRTPFTVFGLTGNPALNATEMSIIGTPADYLALNHYTTGRPPAEFIFAQHVTWFLTYYNAPGDDQMTHIWAIAGQRDPDWAGFLGKRDLVSWLTWGAPTGPYSNFDRFVLVPVVDISMFLLSFLVGPEEFTWFSPWPLTTALALVLAIFAVSAVGLVLWLTVFRTRCDPRAMRSEKLSVQKPHAPLWLELGSYFSVLLTIGATATFCVSRLLVEQRVWLSNPADRRFYMNGGYPSWETIGAPDPNHHLYTALGVLLLGSMLAVSIALTQHLNEAVRALKRFSVRLSATSKRLSDVVRSSVRTRSSTTESRSVLM